MFDKLIESNSAEAEFKPRRKFFMVSSVVVGIMFLSALMISLYAQKLDLGTESFELSAIMAQVPDTPEPEPPRQQSAPNDRNQVSELPNRPELIERLADSTKPPDSVSTVRNSIEEIPFGRFTNNKDLPSTAGSGESGRVGNDAVGSTSAATETSSPETKPVDPPPPPIERRNPPRPKTEGVINGKATYLPVPPYPKPAQMVGAYGAVNVQVTIDEEGKVISSKAVSGHPLLRQTAESAAWKAKFSPTYLSRVPVKVTGVIVFNFRRN
jgi:TonB family protein